MKTSCWMRCAALVLMLASLHAGAASVYKYREPGGGTLYSQKPVANARLIAVMQVQNPSSGRLSVMRVEQERQHAQQLYQEIMESRRIELLATASRESSAERCDTSQMYSSVFEPRPGERTGTVSGHSRLNQNYWNRLGVYPSPTICSVPCFD